VSAETPPDGVTEWVFNLAVGLVVAGFSAVAAMFRTVFSRIDRTEERAAAIALKVSQHASADSRDLWGAVSGINAKLDIMAEERHKMELRLLKAINLRIAGRRHGPRGDDTDEDEA